MKKRKYTDRIIFHHSLASSSGLDEIRAWHTDPKPLGNGWEDVAYHFIVRKTGEIQHGRNILLVGAHCYGRNSTSVGVCLEGDMRTKEPTEAQMDACVMIVHDVCRAYSRGMSIQFHRPRWMWNACPGRKLDRADFLECMNREIHRMDY